MSHYKHSKSLSSNSEYPPDGQALPQSNRGIFCSFARGQITRVRINFRKDTARSSTKEWIRACNDSPAERFSTFRSEGLYVHLGTRQQSQQPAGKHSVFPACQFTISSTRPGPDIRQPLRRSIRLCHPAASFRDSGHVILVVGQPGRTGLSATLERSQLRKFVRGKTGLLEHPTAVQQPHCLRLYSSPPHVQPGTKPNNAGIESNRTAVVVNGFFLRQYKRGPASVWWGFANAREHGRDKSVCARRGFDRPFRSANFTPA